MTKEYTQKNEMLQHYINKCVDIMHDAHIVLPKIAKTSLYHHDGVDNIENTGAMFINVVNRDYCKSFVVMTKGQLYPVHYHRIKTESFYVLYGTLKVKVDQECFSLLPGEMIHIGRGQDHSFWTEEGVVFEEISTMYVNNDSVYLNEEIKKKTYPERRTILSEDDWKEIQRRAES